MNEREDKKDFGTFGIQKKGDNLILLSLIWSKTRMSYERS